MIIAMPLESHLFVEISLEQRGEKKGGGGVDF